MTTYIEEGLQQEIYAFLDDLRDGGTINMFGAPKLVEENFNIHNKMARLVVKDWMYRKNDKSS
jgi:hypothetical protein